MEKILISAFVSSVITLMLLVCVALYLHGRIFKDDDDGDEDTGT